MNKFVFFLISLLFLSSCSVLKRRQVPEKSETTKSQAKTLPAVKEVRPPRSSKAVWHLIEPLGLELTVTSLDKKQTENLLMDTTLSQVEMDPGEWQITGFSLDGKKFQILDSSKDFTFKLKKKKASYAGSIIVQCPVVGQSHLASMKKMSFFNRLTFKSGNNLCEMVIGNEFKNVRKVYTKLSDKKALPLILGF